MDCSVRGGIWWDRNLSSISSLSWRTCTSSTIYNCYLWVEIISVLFFWGKYLFCNIFWQINIMYKTVCNTILYVTEILFTTTGRHFSEFSPKFSFLLSILICHWHPLNGNPTSVARKVAQNHQLKVWGRAGPRPGIFLLEIGREIDQTKSWQPENKQLSLILLLLIYIFYMIKNIPLSEKCFQKTFPWKLDIYRIQWKIFFLEKGWVWRHPA